MILHWFDSESFGEKSAGIFSFRRSAVGNRTAVVTDRWAAAAGDR